MTFAGAVLSAPLTDRRFNMAYRFATSTAVITPGAKAVLGEAGVNPMSLIRRHFGGEWNGLPDNTERNEEYLADGEGMLMSIFDVASQPIWVISYIGYGLDSYTTVLLPEEY